MQIDRKAWEGSNLSSHTAVQYNVKIPYERLDIEKQEQDFQFSVYKPQHTEGKQIDKLRRISPEWTLANRNNSFLG